MVWKLIRRLRLALAGVDFGILFTGLVMMMIQKFVDT